jgi:hypothetical protein
MKKRKSIIFSLVFSSLLWVGITQNLVFNATPVFAKTTQADKKELTVYITRTGRKYHRAGCRYLRRSSYKISKDEAVSRGYAPCKVCRP